MAAAKFACGADIGWLTEMEKAGLKFRKPGSTAEQGVIASLKDKGINSIRLRVFVNPSDKWCNLADVIAKAKRAKAQGMRIMVDFHYSDTFADPGHQKKPASWANATFEQLIDNVFNHTSNVLLALKKEGIVVEWVQVGNETNDGMLWPTGRLSTNTSQTTTNNFGLLQYSGYRAVKFVFPVAKVIVHCAMSNYDTIKWTLDRLYEGGGRWDVIGLSHYPNPNNWQAGNNKCVNIMNQLILDYQYKYEVMICEFGLPAADVRIGRNCLEDLIKKTNGLPFNTGNGIFYWEPECYGDWKKYYKGAFDDLGRPTIVLDAFKTTNPQ